MPHHADETLHALRRRVAAIEAQGAGRPAGRGLALGIGALDRMLGGGFALGALHEITPAAPTDFGAAVSFALALLARALAAEGAGESLPRSAAAGAPLEDTIDQSGPAFAAGPCSQPKFKE